MTDVKSADSTGSKHISGGEPVVWRGWEQMPFVRSEWPVVGTPEHCPPGSCPWRPAPWPGVSVMRTLQSTCLSLVPAWTTREGWAKE